MRLCPGCRAVCSGGGRLCASCGGDLSQDTPPVADPLLGAVLCEKYRLDELIGAGAMGRVYRAQHLQMDSLVAVKILNPELSSDRTTIRRFQQEARAASRLRHPNSIRIYDFGQAPGGLLYLVMELLAGRTLGHINRHEGPLSPARIAQLLGPALLALDEAHHADVVHRDFKPENIFIEKLRSGEEQVKVLDFGIAKARGMPDSSITSSGSVCGTPDYMSPEQIRGEDLDGRSDVYAAGVVLYELLTGSRPFEGSLLEVLTRHMGQAPEPPRKRRPDLQIPEALEAVCMTAMSKRREDRYGSAVEMERVLAQTVRSLGAQACPACGEPASPGTRFCPFCGAALGSGPPRPRDPGRPELPRWPEGLIGRQDALRRLAGLDRRAVVIAGRSGIGKSRLLHTWLAQLGGARPVVQVGPDASCARTPLRPIRAALAQALGISERPGLAELDLALRSLRSGASAGSGAERSLDRPGLAELFGVWEATVSAPYDVRRRECFAAALGTLRRLQVLLVFEDVDRYDGPSQQILARLCADSGEATVVLSTSAPAALFPPEDGTEPAGEGGAEVAAGPIPCEVIELGPLPEATLTDLGLPPAVLEAGAGVPRDLEQAWRAAFEGAPSASMSGRLELLPAEARRMLEALAVVGTQAKVGLLSELSESRDPRAALKELALRGFVRLYGEIVEAPSPSVRDVIYHRIAPERRQRLHHQCWRRLEERGAGATVLAHHALLADPQSVPLPVLERAGDAARNGFDDEGAERWFRQAYGRARRLVQDRKAPKDVLLQAGLRLALTLRYAGKIVDAEQMLREVLALGQGDARAEADARRGLARLAYAWDQPAAARQELYGAIRAAWLAGDPQLLVDLYLELGDVMWRAQDLAAAERELREGIDSVTSGDGIESEQGPVGLWRLLLRLAELVLSAGPRRYREALEVGRHALRWAEKAASPAARSRAESFLGRVHKALGEPQVAARYHQRAVEDARLAGDRRSTAELLIIMADALQDAGEAAGSGTSPRALLMEASSLSQQVGWGEGVRRVAEQMATIEE